MNKELMKKIVAKCVKEPTISKAKAFLLVEVNREAVGMGGSGALVWKCDTGGWKARFLRMVNRSAADEEGLDIIGLEDFYDDDPAEDQLTEDETEEAADCGITYSGSGFDVCFHAHVNRTGDGLRVKEDFVSVEQGNNRRELPVVYWNSGSQPIKADGTKLLPGSCRVSLPGDPARLARKKLKQEQDECLIAMLKQHSAEQARAVFQEVKEKIMEWKPDWTEAQAHKAAEMFLAQNGSV